jgi:hypothetical protein
LGASLIMDPMGPSHQRTTTVGAVLNSLIQDPKEHFIRRWNWKSALLSSLFRGAIFFSTNLVVGWNAALAALLTEFVFRSATSGFYGSLTEAFRDVEPEWAGTVATMVLLPIVSHSLEFTVHYLRGTAKLGLSIAVSVGFTALSTAFNLYAMRQGVLVVGAGRRSLLDDLRLVPRLIVSFVWAGCRYTARAVKSLFGLAAEARSTRPNSEGKEKPRSLAAKVQLDFD